MIPLDAAAFEMAVDYRTGPTVLQQKPGTLALRDGWLSFTEAGGRVRFESPLLDFHSPALAEMGSAVQIWLGPHHHRLVMTGAEPARYWPPALARGGVGTVLAVEASIANLAHFRDQKEAAADLVVWLGAHVGDRPPGVKVRRPAGRLGYALKAIAAVVLVTAAAFGIVWSIAG